MKQEENQKQKDKEDKEKKDQGLEISFNFILLETAQIGKQWTEEELTLLARGIAKFPSGKETP
jgi:hypothetical protein